MVNISKIIVFDIFVDKYLYMKIAILGTRGIPNNYGGFEQCAEYLSVGLVERGHSVIVYSPDFHPYKENTYKGVEIIRKTSPQNIFGNSASNFIYDYLCLRDAVKKDIDIILELGLITSALSIILCKHNGKLITTNIDGLEWKRSKWSKIIQKITKSLEKYGVKYSDYLIADNIGIKEYLYKEYKREAKFIAYGAVDIKSPKKECLKNYGIEGEYILSIARLEPENNLEMMCDAYIKSSINCPYIIIGNHLTKYGDYLKDKYRQENIIFLGGIFKKDVLDNIRFYSKYYLHGHSVGGTNPALLEAMTARALILTHNNKFNRSVVEGNAFYFSNTEELTRLLDDSTLIEKKKNFTINNITKINKTYRWSVVVDEYERYLLKILNESSIQQ